MIRKNNFIYLFIICTLHAYSNYGLNKKFTAINKQLCAYQILERHGQSDCKCKSGFFLLWLGATLLANVRHCERDLESSVTALSLGTIFV